MLPILEIPRSRAHGSGRPVSETEGEDIRRAVSHAVGLYRAVLEGLGIDPFAALPGHDTPRQRRRGLLSPLCPLPAAAFRADQPLAPIENGKLSRRTEQPLRRDRARPDHIPGTSGE
jgi:hypothetical protein